MKARDLNPRKTEPATMRSSLFPRLSRRALRLGGSLFLLAPVHANEALDVLEGRRNAADVALPAVAGEDAGVEAEKPVFISPEWVPSPLDPIWSKAVLFEDPEKGGFRTQAMPDKQGRVKKAAREPAENARTARFLMELTAITGESRYRQAAERALAAFAEDIEKAGPEVADWALARRTTSIDALPVTTGTECRTCGAPSSATASASESGRTEFTTPGETPNVLALPGCTPIVVVPNCVNCSTMYRFTPSPIEVSSTTAVTPMPIPSAVNALRSRCAVID